MQKGDQTLWVQEIDFGTPEFDQAVHLRYRVLREPLGLDYTAEQLAEEYGSWHLAGFTAVEGLVAYLNLVPLEGGRVKMRQVAVDPALQGKGMGTVLVQASERFARAKGARIMELHARETAVPFYLRLGYGIVGERFTEVGIPHFKMEKLLL